MICVTSIEDSLPGVYSDAKDALHRQLHAQIVSSRKPLFAEGFLCGSWAPFA